jgi:uncharacterized coiled-coil protein SlyX
MTMPKQMNHAEYQKSLKKKTIEELNFIISDCRATIQAMPDSENVGYYTDEIHYAYAELKRRKPTNQDIYNVYGRNKCEC